MNFWNHKNCDLFQKCEYGDPEAVLGMALDPPQPQTVTRAMSLLHSVGACSGGQLTPLGHHLAALPVHVRIGKMLLYGAVFDCLEPVVRGYHKNSKNRDS